MEDSEFISFCLTCLSSSLHCFQKLLGAHCPERRNDGERGRLRILYAHLERKENMEGSIEAFKPLFSKIPK